MNGTSQMARFDDSKYMYLSRINTAIIESAFYFAQFSFLFFHLSYSSRDSHQFGKIKERESGL